jgi:putative flippase GtrA
MVISGDNKLTMKTLIKYIISGSIGVLTHLVLLTLMVETMNMPEVFASNISFCIGATVNYLLQHNFVYNCEGGHGKHASRFAMVTLMGLLINYVVFSRLLAVIDFYLLAQLMTLIIVFVFSFIINTTFTFRKETL